MNEVDQSGAREWDESFVLWKELALMNEQQDTRLLISK